LDVGSVELDFQDYETKNFAFSPEWTVIFKDMLLCRTGSIS